MYDKTLTCKDCAAQFIFTARDQAFYAEKGFENEPQRCRDCRTARKTGRPGQPAAAGGASGGGGAREMFDAICAQCGVETTLPFRPRGDKPVYCRTCFATAGAVNAG